MAVPDFQSLMLPLLRMAADGREHSLSGARDVLATEFHLSAPPLTSASTRRPRRVSLADSSRWSCARRSSCCW